MAINNLDLMEVVPWPLLLQRGPHRPMARLWGPSTKNWTLDWPNRHPRHKVSARRLPAALELFSRQCLRRGRIEGAFLIMSQLQDSAWDATEGIDYDDIELSENPFLPIWQTLDLLYQHEEEVELPERCQEFFEQFA